LHSPTKLTYTYNGKTFTNYLGNYYSDFDGVDENGDGIGDTPYKNIDFYPLITTFENYITNQNYSKLDLTNNKYIPNVSIINNINNTINITKMQQMSSSLPTKVNTSFHVISINSFKDNQSLEDLSEYEINSSMDDMAYTINQSFERFLDSVNGAVKKISDAATTMYKIIKGIFYLIFESDDDFEINSNNTAVYYDPNMVMNQIEKCLNDTK